MRRSVVAVMAVGVLLGTAVLVWQLPKVAQRSKEGVEPSGQMRAAWTKKLAHDAREFRGFPLEHDNVKLKFEGQDLALTLPVYHQNNRYFLPLSEIAGKLGWRVSFTPNERIAVDTGREQVVLNPWQAVYFRDGRLNKLRTAPLVWDQVVYVSMFDFCKMFQLKPDWDIQAQTLGFYRLRNDVMPKRPLPDGKRPALLRLEDIAAGHLYGRPEALEKLRIVTDYLDSEDIPFYVAWVPRYIDPRPGSKLDNDVANQYSMVNADFVYTLDYMLDHHGYIGLHGYTHQYGTRESIDGIEFHVYANDGIPGTLEYAGQRVDLAIAAARKLDIPYSFFEAPHYAVTAYQLQAIEPKFDIIYEHYPGVYSQIVTRKNGEHATRYIPTPLDYVNGKEDAPRMLKKINNLSGGLGSLFYHPYLEFDDIKLMKEADGYPTYTYAETSVLHQIVRAFSAKGYKFVTFKDI